MGHQSNSKLQGNPLHLQVLKLLKTLKRDRKCTNKKIKHCLCTPSQWLVHYFQSCLPRKYKNQYPTFRYLLLVVFHTPLYHYIGYSVLQQALREHQLLHQGSLHQND